MCQFIKLLGAEAQLQPAGPGKEPHGRRGLEVCSWDNRHLLLSMGRRGRSWEKFRELATSRATMRSLQLWLQKRGVSRGTFNHPHDSNTFCSSGSSVPQGTTL